MTTGMLLLPGRQLLFFFFGISSMVELMTIGSPYLTNIMVRSCLSEGTFELWSKIVCSVTGFSGC